MSAETKGLVTDLQKGETYFGGDTRPSVVRPYRTDGLE